VLLIAANLAVFVWQLGFSSDDYSSTELRALGVPEADQKALEYGAIPYRLTHPGDDCAVGVVQRRNRQAQADVVCQGTPDYADALALSRAPGAVQAEACEGGCPFVAIDAPAWWVTVLTSMFMHGGILHLVGNMLFLWVFGNNIEDALGRFKFIAFYVAAGAVAVYAQTVLEPEATVPTIGASGAVAGVLGAYILLHPRARVLTMVLIVFFITFIEIPAMVLLGVWFVLQALPVAGQLAGPEAAAEGGVAYLAHIGGFLFGLAAIKLLVRRRPPAPPPSSLAA
jgi:membrane associated rhomboid family serine protease